MLTENYYSPVVQGADTTAEDNKRLMEQQDAYVKALRKRLASQPVESSPKQKIQQEQAWGNGC